MRELWQRYGHSDEGMPETAFEALAQEVSGLDLADFFASAVRGTEDLPLAPLLADLGVILEFRRDKRFARAASGKGAAASPPLELGIRFRQHIAGLDVVAVMADSLRNRPVSARGFLIAIDGLKLSGATSRHDCQIGPDNGPLTGFGTRVAGVSVTLAPAALDPACCVWRTNLAPTRRSDGVAGSAADRIAPGIPVGLPA